MRIALASWTVRHAGGVESYLDKVIRALGGSGHQVSFFHETEEPAGRDNIDVGNVPVFSAARTGVDAAVAAIHAWKPDVMFMHGLRDPDTFDRLTALAPSVSFIHSYFGTCISGSKTHTRPHAIPCAKRFGAGCLVHYFPRGCGGNSPVTMWRLYQRESRQLAILRRQDAVITHSAHMQRELAAHGVTADVIPYAVSTPDAGCDRKSDIASEIIYAGRMDPLKGGMLLLDALPSIQQRMKGSLRVVFAGDGPDRSRWEARAAALAGRHPQIEITFTGWCGETRLATLMRDSRLLVVPSVWPEPFGSVGMSAARHGIPAAAFAVGGISQWLHDGVNGHLASALPPTAIGLADAVVKCLADPRHYTELSNGARRVAATFTMDRHLPELSRILERAIDARR
jgi:glycosyltransferase involved in cell wall biosynthesis